MPEPAPVNPSLVAGSIKGLCPRCGAPGLFAGMLRFAKRCSACGLDYTRFDVGDGPAAFITLIVGTIVVALAIWVQLAAEPPLWVHVVLWVPISALAVIGGLRIAKAALLWSEYRQHVGGSQGGNV